MQGLLGLGMEISAWYSTCSLVCTVVWMSRFSLDRKDTENSKPASRKSLKHFCCSVCLSLLLPSVFLYLHLLSSLCLVLFLIISFPPESKYVFSGFMCWWLFSACVSAGRRDSVWRASWRFSTCCWQPRLGFVSWSFRGRSTSVWRPWSSSTPVSVTCTDGPQPSLYSLKNNPVQSVQQRMFGVFT